jgi:hypothetical protein
MKISVSTCVLFLVFALSETNLFAQTPSSASVSGTITPVKPADYNTFTYLISGLSTITEADDLEALFKSRPGIIEATTDTYNHSITIHAPFTMPESDLLEVLKYAGKTIINSPKELSKFY